MAADARVGLAAVRAAARRRAAETSVRATAAEIGMSYTGLRHFLSGGRPQRRTVRKLLEWHLAHRSGGAARFRDVPAEDVEAAISVLEVYMSARGRETLRPQRVREVTERLFGRR